MEFKLPLGITSASDVIKLLDELEELENFIIAAGANKTASEPAKLTKLLEQTIRDNQVNLNDEMHRRALRDQLKLIQKKSPALHISFAAEPSPRVLEQILAWFRTNVHPYVMLSVGLQPGIAAGCVLRTPNKVFDMSLRNSLEKERDYLLQLIKGAINVR